MADEYVTTNIRLPRALHRALKHRAVEEHKSLAQLVRESVAAYLTRPPEDIHDTGRDVWQADSLRLIGADPVDADVPDGAFRHDDYLYGERPERSAPD
jgi:hypothetical protein